jgi:phage tail sheath gpL-like
LLQRLRFFYALNNTAAGSVSECNTQKIIMLGQKKQYGLGRFSEFE